MSEPVTPRHPYARFRWTMLIQAAFRAQPQIRLADYFGCWRRHGLKIAWRRLH